MTACFIGLGYVGLPTAIIAAGHGIRVTGVDTNPDVVTKTNRGELHIVEPGLESLLKETVASGMLMATDKPEICDAYFIVVPTPFTGAHRPDISYVEAATESVIPLLKEDDLFVIESTSPVGTTEHIADKIFGRRPELRGKLHIAYCPERILPGNVIYELVHNDRVIGGIDATATEKAAAFYRRFVQGALHYTSARTAEMCKLTENSSRDVQIAFANELSLICDEAGIDVWELIDLANKHPRVNILQPGCGVGGHCIAVDPYFITAAFPQRAQLIAKAREINNYKAEWCAEKVYAEILRFRLEHGRLPAVAMLGLAFKPNIDDLRESPAKFITRTVLGKGTGAYIMVAEPNVAHLDEFDLTDYREAWEKADIAVLMVAHDQFRTLPSEGGDKKILDFAGVFRHRPKQ